MATQSDGFLWRHFRSNSHRLLGKWVHYLDIDDRHIGLLRGRAPVRLEIGVFGGGLRAPGSVVEFVKEKLEEFNAAHRRGAVAITDRTAPTQAIRAVLRQQPEGRRNANGAGVAPRAVTRIDRRRRRAVRRSSS